MRKKFVFQLGFYDFIDYFHFSKVEMNQKRLFHGSIESYEFGKVHN